jgi:hypothetical protein
MDPFSLGIDLQTGVKFALLACPVALAEGACSDVGVKDVFIQGGQQVLEANHLKITSLIQDEHVAWSELSLTREYLMVLSDHSTRWVRCTFSQDAAGEMFIDDAEETKNTVR